MEYNLLQSLTVGVFVAASAGLLGSFAILKKMALVGDALSHVALPGIALALTFNFNPFLGALAFLFVATLGIWLLEYRSRVPIDAIVGIFFATSLALGALITPETELLEALFGDIAGLDAKEAAVSIAASIALFIFLLVIRKKLTLNMVSQDLAHSIGVKNKKLELLYLLIFALAVALGIRFVGALLMGSLVVIPAASAKNLAKSLRGFLALSVVFAVASAVLGIFIASLYDLQPGPIFILAGSAFFILSLAARGLFKK